VITEKGGGHYRKEGWVDGFPLIKLLYFKRRQARRIKKLKQRVYIIIFFNKSKIETRYKEEEKLEIKKEKNNSKLLL